MHLAERYPLTPAQEGMLYRGLTAPVGVNVEQVLVHLDVPVAPAVFRGAWQVVVDRHAALRTRLRWKAAVAPEQEVSLHVDAPVTEHALGTDDVAARLDAIAVQDRATPFALGKSPLFRVNALVDARGVVAFLFTFQHVILDGPSIALVLYEVMAVCRGTSPSDLPVPPPFRSYVERLASMPTEESVAYWLSQLQGLELPTPIPVDHPASAKHARHIERTRTLPHEVLEALERNARAAGVRLSTMVMAAWSVVLARHAGTSSVVFGTTRLGRSGRDATADMVGMLIQTIALRVDVDDDGSLRDLLRHTRARWDDARPHAHLHTSIVRNELGTSTVDALFHSLLVFDSNTVKGALAARDPRWSGCTISRRSQTDVPLTLAVTAADELALHLEYDEEVLDEARAERLLSRVARLLQELAGDLDRPLRTVRMIDEREQGALATWAQGEVISVARGALHDVLQEGMRSEAPALEADGESSSYGTLWASAHRTAQALARRGVRPQGRVLTLLPRDARLVTTWLGVLEAGAAFVPLDLEHPVEHIAYVLRNVKASHVVTTAAHRASRAFEGTDAIVLDVEELARDAAQAPAEPLALSVPEDAVAYVLYTSGSTGTPKGVEVTHRSLVHHAHAVRHAYGLSASDRTMFFSSPAFDVALEELFPSLLAGACIVVRPRELPPPTRFGRWIEQRAISVVNVPTAYWHEWMRFVDRGANPWPRSVRLLVVGGERASPAAYERFRAVADAHVGFVNAYGPTECTVTATIFDDRLGHGASRDDIPIGKPLPNVRAYVIDVRGNLAPPGVTGELCLAGPQVARGYVDRPEETSRRFVPDPFHGGECMYRTGDRAQYREDGLITFIGRTDEQLKIRGHRIEPAALEAALVRHPGVADAVVAAFGEFHDARLVAFVARNEKAQIDGPQLRDYLLGHFPAGMVPSEFVVLDSLPRTATGKIDRRALKPPARVAVEAPLSPVAETLARIWSEALGGVAVRPDDNLFDLGAHSLLVLRVIDQAAQAGFRLDPQLVTRHPTVGELADAVEMNTAPEDPSLVALGGRGRGEPLFLVHTTPGDIIGYMNLVDALHSPRPIYGLQSVGLSDLSRAHRSIDDMAEHYVRSVRRVQPRGPYFLGGWCYGGYVAVEMARRLRAEGESIALLALMEAPAPRPAQGRPRYFAERLHRLVRRGPNAVLTWVARRARRSLGQPDGEIQTMLGYEVARGPLANRAQVYELNMKAFDAYRVKRYAGALTLFRAAERAGAHEDPTMGWGPIANAVQTYDVPGTHETILLRPQVDELATCLRHAIDLAAQAVPHAQSEAHESYRLEPAPRGRENDGGASRP